jgi:sugar lactone lactonase YvrE
MSKVPEELVKAENQLGEGPVWCPRTQALWWIDVQQPTLWKWTHTTASVERWKLPKPPANISLLEDGAILIMFRTRAAIFREDTPELQWLDLSSLKLGEERFNDSKVDRLGRLWVGTLDRAVSRPLGRLYRMEAGMSFHAVDAGFPLSNGIGWSPDSRKLYFSETHERRIYHYDFDLASGNATNRQVLVQLPEGPGGPDGLTVDAEGGIWCALFDRGCVNRYLPTGELDQSIEMPVTRPTSCTIGGPALRTLYITSARLGLSAEELVRQMSAGSVFALELDQRGQVAQRCSLRLEPVTPPIVQ